MSTISSVIRASEARRARRAVPLITRALFQKLSGTNVPSCNHAPTDEVAHSPRPQAPASEISHVIRLLDNSTTATNVAIPTSRFQCLKDTRGNYVRDCWETVTLTSFSRSQSRGTACEIVGKPRHNEVQQPQRTPRPQPENRPRPHPQAPASEISHVIRLLDTSTTATNVAIPTSGFQCLKDMRGNYVRDCWETTTQRPSTPQPPTHSEAATGKPATASSMDADQMRKGSFFTSPRPFHHRPSPSVSPALVSGMRIRTSA